MKNLEINLLEEIIKIEIEKIRPTEEIRSELDFGYSFKENVLEVLEIRPDWQDKSIILSTAIAKTSYDKTNMIWKIYWMRQNGKWVLYKTAEVKTIQQFFEILGQDKYGCFFG